MSSQRRQTSGIIGGGAVLWGAVLWLACVCFHAGSLGSEQASGSGSPLSNARRLFLTGRYDEAIELYRAERKESPAEASIGLARCYATRGQIDLAREALRLKAAESPTAEVFAEQARIEWHAGRHADARTLADKALNLDGKCVLARWLDAQLLSARGDLDGANRANRWLLDFYNQADEIASPDDLRWIGLAAADYARFNRLPDQFSLLVNELFPAALARDADYWPAHLEMARLFMEKYSQAEAARALADAQRINASSPDVLAAAAQLALEQFDVDSARRLLARARGIHPQHLESLLVQADIHFGLFDFESAVNVLKKAEQVNPRHEAALGRMAAAIALQTANFDPAANPPLEALVRQVRDVNPHAGEFYVACAGALDQCRQYPAARDFLQEAIEVKPQLVGPRGQLGLIHMRLADEETARPLLEEAFKNDPFNVRVRNTLEVLDVLDTYETLETEHFVIRFDPRRDRVLACCAADYLEEIYPELTQRLDFAPPEKTLFEIFNDARHTKGHGWFSARMVGLPQIHTVGACAGKMVALASPTSMPEQPFHWGRVLRHEFVHVINLQQTRFNVPRWFTEALAVRLEELPRPANWETVLAKRVSQGNVFNLADINLGFIRPQSSDDWALAYCQAELYADHLVERFGEDVLRRMLEAYRDGLSTPAAIERSCRIGAAEFERSYMAYLRTLTSELVATGAAQQERSFVELRLEHQANPDDLETAAELAELHLRRQQYPQARAIAEKVLESEPRHQLASYVLARLHLVTGEREQAETLLSKSLDEQFPEPDLVKLLASLNLKTGRTDEAVRLLELGARHQPRDLSWIKTLAAIALKQGNDEQLTGYLERLATADPDDLLVRKKLAVLAEQREDHAAAASWSTDVLLIDVRDGAMHKLRARSLAQLKKHRQAADAYRLAVMLAPDEQALWPEYVQQCRQASLADRAREAVQLWLQHHPNDARALAHREELSP